MPKTLGPTEARPVFWRRFNGLMRVYGDRGMNVPHSSWHRSGLFRKLEKQGNYFTTVRLIGKQDCWVLRSLRTELRVWVSPGNRQSIRARIIIWM